MIEVAAVDLSAESRRTLSGLIEKWSWVGPERRVSLPRLSINLVAPEEVRFFGSIDVCIIGPELLAVDAAFISILRSQLPGTIILCVLDSASYSFGLIEQLGRLGVDDIVLDTATSDEFYRRLLLLQRRVASKKKGKLTMVTSARGGVGATFTAAALAEGLAEQNQRVCVVDCDVTSQDLTRFLEVRPFVNEPLKLILDQQRVASSETVSECIRFVWNDDTAQLACMPPPVGPDSSLFMSAQASRALAAVLDVLLLQFDCVVVDGSSLAQTTQQALLATVDNVVFVMNRDPAGAYANRQALTLFAGGVHHDATLTVVLNHSGGIAAPVSILRADVICAPGRSVQVVCVPYSKRASRWACSGKTPYFDLRRHYKALLSRAEEKKAVWGWARTFRLHLQSFFVTDGRSRSSVEPRVNSRGNEEPHYTKPIGNDGRRPVLAAQIRGLLPQMVVNDESLVSKPVLMGH